MLDWGGPRPKICGSRPSPPYLRACPWSPVQPCLTLTILINSFAISLLARPSRPSSPNSPRRSGYVVLRAHRPHPSGRSGVVPGKPRSYADHSASRAGSRRVPAGSGHRGVSRGLGAHHRVLRASAGAACCRSRGRSVSWSPSPRCSTDCTCLEWARSSEALRCGDSTSSLTSSGK